MSTADLDDRGVIVACPACGSRGYLDHIDPFREVMFMHCTECYTKYELARADMKAEASDEAFTI